jgi:hypothetical protein
MAEIQVLKACHGLRAMALSHEGRESPAKLGLELSD